MEIKVKNPIFIDTGFVLALFSPRDQYHNQAVNLSIKYESYLWLTTDAILLEVGNAFSRHSKQKGAEVIEQFLDSDDIQIVHLTPQLFNQGLGFYKFYQDKQSGLVDCVSFTVMREMGIDQVLTFDQHFAQAGFQVLVA
jgi:uncharacterized protein